MANQVQTTSCQHGCNARTAPGMGNMCLCIRLQIAFFQVEFYICPKFRMYLENANCEWPIKCTPPHLIVAVQCKNSARSAKRGRCRREGGRSLVPTLVLVQTVHKHLSTSFSSKRCPAPERLSLIFISFHSNGSALFLHSHWPLKCYDIVSTS